MLGHFKTKHEIRDELNLNNTNPLPPCFDRDQCNTITNEYVVWFDEYHFNQDSGPPSLNNLQIRFPRDKDGNYDRNSATYNPKQSKPSYKYPEQDCFCFGIAKVKL